jgi:hypothetical protein
MRRDNSTDALDHPWAVIAKKTDQNAGRHGGVLHFARVSAYINWLWSFIEGVYLCAAQHDF